MLNTYAIGNLVADPRFATVPLKSTGETAEVANFRIAINMGRDQEPRYLDCTCWRGLAKPCKYLSKGREVFVEGIPKARHNASQKTGKIYDNLELTVTSLKLLGSQKKTEPEPQPAAGELYDASVPPQPDANPEEELMERYSGAESFDVPF